MQNFFKILTLLSIADNLSMANHHVILENASFPKDDECFVSDMHFLGALQCEGFRSECLCRDELNVPFVYVVGL